MKKRFIFSLLAVASLYIVGCKKSQTNDAEFSNAPKDLAALYKESWGKVKPYLKEDVQRAPGSGSSGSTTLEEGLPDSIALDIITPMLNPTTEHLLQNYDIDLADYFDSLNDPRIALVGNAVLRIEQLESQGYTVDTTFMELVDRSGIPLLGRTPNVWDCALKAIGITAAKELLQAIADIERKALTRAVVLKAVRTIASRYASLWGIVTMGIEFVVCMEWL